jgi:hypothetical protein
VQDQFHCVCGCDAGENPGDWLLKYLHLKRGCLPNPAPPGLARSGSAGARLRTS